MRITRAFGIPVRLHWSFLGLVGVYALSTLMSGGVGALLSTLVLITALFGSVVLHELGHALMARVFGLETAHITLYPFGGIAALQGQPKRPGHELLIALAGPAVNVVLAAVAATLWMIIGGELLGIILLINVAMAIFNMIPAYPMDGGRVFRAALQPFLGYFRASRLAIGTGSAFGWLFVAVGVVSFYWSLTLVGAFLIFATSAELRRLRWQERAAEVGRPAYRPEWTVAPR